MYSNQIPYDDECVECKYINKHSILGTSLKFENVQLPDSVGFRCKKCGICCREQPADLIAEEQLKIEEKGFKHFLGDPDEVVDYIRFIRRKKDGSCFFLGKDDECSIYEIRPATCRIQPFTITDWDYDNNVIEVDLPADFHCTGIMAKGTLPVEELARAAQTIVQDLQKTVAKVLGLPITDKKVLSDTRILIMGMIDKRANE
jgi:Fe-S-cluster containining protein